MKKLTIILIALLTSQLCFAQSELDKALTKAKKENKLVFIDTYFTGCIPCEQMDKEVFPNSAVNKALSSNFVTLKVNVFTEKLGDTLKTQHILNGFPTFLVLNNNGNLVASVSGYKDPGDLITFLSSAKSKADKGLLHGGYSANYNEKNYPSFYVEFAKTRKGITALNLKAYSDTLNNFKATNSLLPFLISRSTNEKVAEEILKDYTTYANLYGEEILQPVVDKILLSKLQATINSSSSTDEFNNFLSNYKGKFPTDRWKINLQTLGTRFYLEMKKDTAAYLEFAIKNPVLYQYHFKALANTMAVKKQLNGAMGKLVLQWADAIVNEGSSMEIIQNAASLNQQLGNKSGYQKMMQMAISRAKKYDMPYQEMEASLKAASK